MVGSEPFIHGDMLSAPMPEVPALSYFVPQQQQPEIVEDAILPTGLQPLPSFMPDDFLEYSEDLQGQPMYTGEFWNKYGGGILPPPNLHAYPQPTAPTGADRYLQHESRIRPQPQPQQGNAAITAATAAETPPTTSQPLLEWGQHFDSSFYSQG
jgi:hypothetical protein